MEATELRTFSVDELRVRVRQWKEELFRNRFKTETQEARDTSVVKKLRRDIARGLTILNEKLAGVEVKTSAPQDRPAAAKASATAETAGVAETSAEDKPAKAKKAKTTKEKPAAKKAKGKVK